MPTYTDQTRNTFTLADGRQRIVSLVPSQTELLHYLGLNDAVVGITKFCVHPHEWFKSKHRIGGTKNVDVSKVESLQPTLVLANKEENVKEQVDAISRFAPVYTSDVNNLPQAIHMIQDVGALTGATDRSNQLVIDIQQAFAELATINNRPLRVAYLIWKRPYMAAAGGTYIHDMLERFGYINVFQNAARYPEVTIDQLALLHCDVILLSSEPYPFKQKDIEELHTQLPGVKVMLVDGEMFSWYGSRLLQAAEYFKQLKFETAGK